ncbi:DNA repair protein rhp41 [Colletotrichum spaethianum]|uniref:DNA repair protein rhp41 n=1 Tax=Colletotrichum spaethianum TaxID=700344 RepID=A0AA37L8P4_9PEZI|nr:DNA repair protein rhp41 [Colletotrichum spaethianum]GKT44096.1 DNA repair protein rhp41 [Colletotrichum spaethianum]
MADRKRTRTTRSMAPKSDVPDVYQEMLAEAAADVGPSALVERPAKRLKRPGEKKSETAATTTKKPEVERVDDDVDEDEDIEFEDVTLPPATVQTMYRDSDDEEEEEDLDGIEFEDIDFGAVQPNSEALEETNKLTLNLSEHSSTVTAARKGVNKRKPLTKEERERRISIHKTHLLCLLLHCALRNRWCDDEQVQKSLRPLLTKQTINYLTPSPSLPQFGQTESLRNGLQQAGSVFKSKFQTTERGLCRPLWAEDPEHLANRRS